MSVLNLLGKAILAGSLCLQAWVLFSDAEAGNNFDSKAKTMILSCPYMSSVAEPLIQNLRMIVVGLLFSSALMIAVRWCIVKFLVLLGLVINLLVMWDPITKCPGLKNTGFWQDVAIIGGIVYLMGADVCTPCAKPAKQSENSEPKKGGKPKRA